jgi:hypothetical protein
MDAFASTPSDSTSQWTPLPLANASYYQARSGLSPPSYSPCRAHLKAQKRQGCRFCAAQGIAAEIPQQKGRRRPFCEELERKARFPFFARSAKKGNAPKKGKRTAFRRLIPAGGNGVDSWRIIRYINFV